MFRNVRSSHWSIDSDGFGMSACRDDGREEDRCLPFISRFCGVIVLVMLMRGASGFEVVAGGGAGVPAPEDTGVCVGTDEAPSWLDIPVADFSSVEGLDWMSASEAA